MATSQKYNRKQTSKQKRIWITTVDQTHLQLVAGLRGRARDTPYWLSCLEVQPQNGSSGTQRSFSPRLHTDKCRFWEFTSVLSAHNSYSQRAPCSVEEIMPLAQTWNILAENWLRNTIAFHWLQRELIGLIKMIFTKILRKTEKKEQRKRERSFFF